MEYEVSIRILFPEAVSGVLKKEKDRFVAEYGSGYKSEPHITLYLDRYTQDGFPKLMNDLRGLRIEPFTISLLKPEVRREEDRHRNLYVVDVSNKERVQELYDKISGIAVQYRSPLLRSKVQRRLEQEGVRTDGTRESLRDAFLTEAFAPHITLGEVGIDDPQPDLTDVQKNLEGLDGQEITVSNLAIFFYGKEDGNEKFKLIEKVVVPLS